MTVWNWTADFVVTGCLASMLVQCSIGHAESPQDAPDDMEGYWGGAVVCPGGDIRFGLEVRDHRAYLVNGPERIEVAEFSYRDGNFRLGFPHYDSTINAQWAGKSFVGTWAKTRGDGNRPQLKFVAVPAHPHRCSQEFGGVEGRWKVIFSSEKEPAVGVFRTSDQICWGTFLTSTGDYRYLSADVADGKLILSCFDGAHAFLFSATIKGNQLEGDFWSGDHWHETWKASRDDRAALANPIAVPHNAPRADFEQLVFRNLDGQLQPLSSANLKGQAIIIELFGSWCPNCHDAARWFAELEREYGEDELSIVGLAFELTGNAERDLEQVRRYVERFNVKYPVFVAGLADKKAASAQFPLLNRIRAYPTTIFTNREGEIISVYHGFSGPATEADYQKLKDRFREIIDGIIQPGVGTASPDQSVSP